MGNIKRKQWSGGWEPNADPNGGNSNALLRMDNLTQEQSGAVSLMRGTALISSQSFTVAINKLYSRVTQGSTLGVGFPTSCKLRYVSLANGLVYRNWGPAQLENTFDLVVLGGGDLTYTAFGTMYGQNLICSGTQKIKDDGLNQRVLTIPANLAPSVSVGAAQIIDAGAGSYLNWVGISGGVVPNPTWVGLAPDATSVSTGGRQGEIQFPSNGTNVTIDTTAFGGISHSDDGGDAFNFVVSGSAISYCTSITIRFLLVTPQAVGAINTMTDYYETFFGLELGALSNTEINTLTCNRRDFTRHGTNPALDWSTVKGIQVILEAGHKGSGISIFNLNFCRQLTGKYQYVQVDVRRDTNYLEIGLPSVATSEYVLSQAMATITANAPDPQANEVWIYRINQSSATATPAYYRVKILTSNFTTPFLDTISDAAATSGAISDSTATLRAYAVSVPDNVQHIVAPISDRALYFDSDTMYVSYRYDFGSIDSRHEFQICANASEQILWVRMVVDGYVLVGTTKDIYRIISTYEEDTNGLLTIDIRGIGLTQPPISSAYAMWGTFLIYLSSEGWKYVAGSIAETFNQQVDLLYRGFSRQGLNALQIPKNNLPTLYCAAASNRFYAVVYDSSGASLIHCYDFNRKTWTMWSCDTNQPACIYAEEDGTVIFGTNTNGDNWLRQFDTGTLLDGITPQEFHFQTVFDDDGLPDNRKEVQNFKITLNAVSLVGNIVLNSVNYDGTTATISLPIILNGYKQPIFDISILGAPTRIQVDFTGTAEILQIIDFEIDYVDHPTLMTSLLVPATNYGSTNRKRIRVVPHMIDTLGNDTVLIPIADGAYVASQTFNFTSKRTALVQIGHDVAAVDWGLLIKGGPFEYYGTLQPYNAQMIPTVTSYWQIGPIELNQRGTFRRIRIRMLPNGSELFIKVFAQDNDVFDATIPTVPFNEDNYTLDFQMGVNASISRIELRMDEGFSYYYSELWTKETGNQTEWEKRRI